MNRKINQAGRRQYHPIYTVGFWPVSRELDEVSEKGGQVLTPKERFGGFVRLREHLDPLESESYSHRYQCRLRSGRISF